MRIGPIDPTKMTEALTSINKTVSERSEGLKAGETGTASPVDFTQTIKKAVAEVNSLQTQADKLAVDVASGDVEDVHKAMIAMQKAKLALDFTIQVRNKVIEAYQEIMRMQI
ncbi:MAG: flagellar hook-basal body complex protein FliE [Armatimonadetes bacterium]|jgi:flagellar hook-basal body complex protein FliE|nr:flagellar hook-basal body complex protein FliE [Armatimonadota bacterium]